MNKWYRRLCLLLVCLVWASAGYALTAIAADCDHDYVEKEVMATCTEGGIIYYECSKCGDQYRHANTEPLGHNFGEWVVTVAPDCGVEGEEERSCSRCDVKETQVVPALEHNYTTSVVEPTCTERGYTETLCVNCGDAERSDYVEALGHTWKTETVEPTCIDEGYTLNTCTVCRATEKSNYVDALGHSWESEVIDPTCTEDGYTLHTCALCRDTKKTDYVDALGHNWESEIVDPTCDEEGYTLNICVVCREREKTDYVDALGHVWESEIVDPTCEKQGYTLHICTVCQEAEKTDYVDALGHRWEGETISPTCKDKGYTLNTCVVCQEQQKVNYVEALGHDLVSKVIAPTCTKGGYTQWQCSRCDHKEKSDTTEKLGHSYDEGVVTKEATDTAMGKMTFTCTACGDTYNESIPKLVNPFVDVSKSAYYYKAVLWAVDKKITSGTDETHFSPNNSCTRAQVVTFLWRAAGSPDPKSTECPFKDVAENSYYRKAVMWAAEQGITSGINATLFGPDNPCTRAQVVTFLYRAAGSPEWTGTDRFTDVDRGSYYYTSVSWAADKGITSGVDGEHFGPNQVCTRAQIVVFLHRDATAE